MKKLTEIQNELKVPKGNFNSFGKYKYRSAEDILEALKPILLKHGAALTLSDEVISVGVKLFIKASAILYGTDLNTVVTGFAEIAEHKGMSAEQCTGTASSYARKYALNGLFLIDETEADADHEKVEKAEKAKPKFTKELFEKANAANATIEQIKSKYELSKEVETKLLESNATKDKFFSIISHDLKNPFVS